MTAATKPLQTDKIDLVVRKRKNENQIQHAPCASGGLARGTTSGSRFALADAAGSAHVWISRCGGGILSILRKLGTTIFSPMFLRNALASLAVCAVLYCLTFVPIINTIYFLGNFREQLDYPGRERRACECGGSDWFCKCSRLHGKPRIWTMLRLKRHLCRMLSDWVRSFSRINTVLNLRASSALFMPRQCSHFHHVAPLSGARIFRWYSQMVLFRGDHLELARHSD